MGVALPKYCLWCSEAYLLGTERDKAQTYCAWAWLCPNIVCGVLKHTCWEQKGTRLKPNVHGRGSAQILSVVF